VRTFLGIRWVFGLITTYNEWRICWLANADDAAASPKLDLFLSLPQQPVPNKRIVHMSRIYKSDDPTLVVALIHLLHKMQQSPRDPLPLPLVRRDRSYPKMSSTSFTWTKYKPTDDLSYELPPSNTHNFFLLQNYHGGGDGHVWLAASASGALAVLKFLKTQADFGEEGRL
jgi:hypothetical protein